MGLTLVSKLERHNGITECVTWRCSLTSIKNLLNSISSSTAVGRALLNCNLQLRYCYTPASHPAVDHDSPILFEKGGLGLQTTFASAIDYENLNAFNSCRRYRYFRTYYRVQFFRGSYFVSSEMARDGRSPFDTHQEKTVKLCRFKWIREKRV
jgi:hypothetical protein